MSINLFSQETRGQLDWINMPTHWTFTEQNELVVEAPPQSDYFQDPAGKYHASSAPFLCMPVGVSFTLTTKLHAGMRHIYDSGCLMFMLDDQNWAKLCFEYNGQYPIIVSVVTRDGVSDDCYSERVTVDNPYLRIVKQDACITFSYSPDGVNWSLIRYFGMPEGTNGVAGVVAQSPKGEGCTVQFESLIYDLSRTDSRF